MPKKNKEKDVNLIVIIKVKAIGLHGPSVLKILHTKKK